MPNRRIVVYAGTSADGFIARLDGDVEWLTSRPKPEGFYDIETFTASIDTKILGRKTYEKSLTLGAKFDGRTKVYVFSTQAAATSPPNVVECSRPDRRRRPTGLQGDDAGMVGARRNPGQSRRGSRRTYAPPAAESHTTSDDSQLRPEC